ncbi:MAG: serine/threonine protein kinase [Deltaproteobacteria bacterium]|nr:serine/threonine protein kinase [Deltaproteobacteria bacterium]
MNQEEIKDRVERWTRRRPPGKIRVFEDTSAFMKITAGDVLSLGGGHYLVYGEETEGRFGLDEQPKFWVKRAIDLATGKKKVVKLAFYESFELSLGEQKVRCYRSPKKEARILEKTAGDGRFMQGISVADAAGNPVRILDRILGKSLYAVIHAYEISHREYFAKTFPSLFAACMDAVHAIADLHAMGEIHGDIRNDHLLFDRESRTWRWIDFDYAYEWTERPFGVDLYGLGNVLLFITGMGFHVLKDMAACLPDEAEGSICLEPSDFSLFFPHRIMNLKKLFPYVPETLNRVLMRFCAESGAFYETAGELLEDLEEAGKEMGQ